MGRTVAYGATKLTGFRFVYWRNEGPLFESDRKPNDQKSVRLTMFPTIMSYQNITQSSMEQIVIY